MSATRVLAAALGYFAVVFGAGFVLGTVRVLWLVPQFGARAAVLSEMPLMLLVVYFAARWVVRRFNVQPAPTAGLAVGFIALACLLTVEFTMVLWLQGISVRESMANRDPVSGAVYVASLIVFALMPRILGARAGSVTRGD